MISKKTDIWMAGGDAKQANKQSRSNEVANATNVQASDEKEPASLLASTALCRLRHFFFAFSVVVQRSVNRLRPSALLDRASPPAKLTPRLSFKCMTFDWQFAAR